MHLGEAKVLIVDDEEALRHIFAKWLTKAGYPVLTAANGEEALRVIDSHPVQVLVTDVRMPVMDGVTLIRRLAQTGTRIPYIIFVSAFGDVDVREMYDLGVVAFLAKPFRFEELESMLRAALSSPRDLWKEPFPQVPHHCVELRGIWSLSGDSLHQPAEARLRIGRGGFRALAAQVAAPGKVAFHCHVTDPAGALLVELNGEGYIRWRSRTDATIGIAFSYLKEPGRGWVLEQIETTAPRAFIPA